MNLNNELALVLGCITGVVGVITLVVSVLSYKEQRAQTKRLSGQEVLPIFNGQISNTGIPMASIHNPGLHHTTNISHHLLSPIGPWAGMAFAPDVHSALKFTYIPHNPSASPGNGANTSNANNVHPATGLAQNLSTTNRNGTPTIAPIPPLPTSPSQQCNSLDTGGACKPAILQDTTAPSLNPVASSCFQTSFIRPEQGDEALTSSRLPAHNDRRGNRRGRRYAEFAHVKTR